MQWLTEYYFYILEYHKTYNISEMFRIPFSMDTKVYYLNYFVFNKTCCDVLSVIKFPFFASVTKLQLLKVLIFPSLASLEIIDLLTQIFISQKVVFLLIYLMIVMFSLICNTFNLHANKCFYHVPSSIKTTHQQQKQGENI